MYLGTLYYLIQRVHLHLHIGVTSSFYTSRFGPIKFLAPLPGISFSVDIDKRQLDITLEFSFLFYFTYTSACNLVFVFCL